MEKKEKKHPSQIWVFGVNEDLGRLAALGEPNFCVSGIDLEKPVGQPCRCIPTKSAARPMQMYRISVEPPRLSIAIVAREMQFTPAAGAHARPMHTSPRAWDALSRLFNWEMNFKPPVTK